MKICNCGHELKKTFEGYGHLGDDGLAYEKCPKCACVNPKPVTTLTSIKIRRKTVTKLKKARKYSRESYDDVINRVL